MSTVYLALAVLGAVGPYAALLPWLAEHGPDLPLLWREIVSSRVSAFAWLDVVLTVVTILVFAGQDARRCRRRFPVLPALACVLVGASCGLPLLLYERERTRSHAA